MTLFRLLLQQLSKAHIFFFFSLSPLLFSHTALSISLKPTWPVSTGGGSWQTHEAKYAASWRVVLHSTLKMSQSAYQPKHAKIRHGHWKWVAQPVGLQTGPLRWFSEMCAITPQGKFCMTEKERKWKKYVKADWVKREGKTLNHLASFLRRGRGWRHLLFCHSQTVETSAICSIKCTGGWSPVLLRIHSSASGQPSYSVHHCVRLRGEEKKGGSRGGKENLSLCVGQTQQESDLVSIWVS